MADDKKGIHVVVINGSMRPNNYTNMASALVVDELKKDPKVNVTVINPAEWHLPFPGTDGASDSTVAGAAAQRCFPHRRRSTLPISVPNVQKVFDSQGHIQDPQIEKVIRSVAINLLRYINANLCPAVTLERLLREGKIEAA